MENNNNSADNINNEIINAYKNAEQFSLLPLLKLIYITNNLNLSSDYKLLYDLSNENSNNLKPAEIIMSKDNKKIKVYLGIVNKSYDLLNSINQCNLLSENITNLNEEPNEALKKQIIYTIMLLTQYAKIIFDSLKNKYQELTEYNLVLSDNTTIYLDYNLDKRIGVIFEEIIE